MDRELLLLGLLRRSDMHGYQLHEFIERDLATCTELKKPTAYFLLDKMTRLGWIVQHEEREGNRPPRRVYHVSAAGEAQFQQLLRTNLSQPSSTRFGGDIGLIFANSLASADVVALLEQRRVVLAADLAATQAAPAHAGSLQLVIEHRIIHLESELGWLDTVIARFTASASTE
ncbi:MAG: helix-turn-helix transcriptional regulator [Herpetosiphonaceae bacterium]|nr:helix-turn-helix transcriptional regulator [Herpetosiphonaceae bacterium]